MAIKLVVVGLLSLRGVSRTFALFEYCFDGGIPCHVVIQNWVMRYGLYKLKKTPKKADDWIFILDHSIEFGKKQCLLVLGVPLKIFRKKKGKLRHEDMEVLAADIIDSATGKSVTETLIKVADKTKNPVQIVSDGGLNIINGCNDFIKQQNCNKVIIKTYDVTHQAALILKHQLKDDPIWQSFCKETAKTKRCLVHTELSYLVPPKPRDKSRWQNLNMYLKWAEMILNQKVETMPKLEAEKFKDKLSWVKTYHSHIKEWRLMLNLLDILKAEVKKHGFSPSTKKNFEKLTIPLKRHTPRLKKVEEQILNYVEDECSGLDGVFLGCSDIIESVFGKYKNFSGKSPMKEIGKAILTIPVFTSSISYSEVKNAMEAVSAQDVIDWQAQNIGTTLLAKRKMAFDYEKAKKQVKKI